MRSPESTVAGTSMNPVAVAPRVAVAVPTVNVAPLAPCAGARCAMVTPASAATARDKPRWVCMALCLRTRGAGGCWHRDCLNHAVLEMRFAVFGVRHEADEHVVAQREIGREVVRHA